MWRIEGHKIDLGSANSKMDFHQKSVEKNIEIEILCIHVVDPLHWSV